MKTACLYCDSPVSQYRGIDGDRLCAECARREIIGLLNDMEPEEVKHYRRRVEDALRKNPVELLEAIVGMAIRGTIKL